MLSDIKIAQNAKMLPINKIAENLDIPLNYLELYGKYKAKIDNSILKDLASKPDGHLILVTAITPTNAGEGKTTVTVGLGQAISKIGKKGIVVLREPSFGPVMGIKGGAAGGGYSQVVPMEDINLHFTGDMHAITTANNLLSAMIDNHLHQGNSLGIDSRQIFWKRAIDMNDRALRNITIGLGGKANGFLREDGFNITAASEIMAVLCLASDFRDLKERLGKILIGYSYNGSPITARDLKANGAMALILKDAIKPNLVQTLENTPVFMHGGPFANIAHGCNSVIATKLALKLADYIITEAGFGADLGAEKFFDIKCRYADLKPSAVVLVATIRALKHSGGCPTNMINECNLKYLKEGLKNLQKHISNLNKFGVPIIVAINKFQNDSLEEIDLLKSKCNELNTPISLTEFYENGGNGGIDLANQLVDLIKTQKSIFKPLYDINLSIYEKIEIIAKEIYGASNISYSDLAIKNIKILEKNKMDKLPLCIAKTQYSLSDNPKLLGVPENFVLNIQNLYISAGAGFIVVLTGSIMTMPGLPKRPASEFIDIDEDGTITGLF